MILAFVRRNTTSMSKYALHLVPNPKGDIKTISWNGATEDIVYFITCAKILNF